ncbi:MAG TPA: hypothetical protein VK789_29635 [Bryobacteraceae bacterium]|nr:hypothetical protein [Bryobacteraceae bacterium]
MRSLRWACVLAGIVALWLSYRPMGAPYITNDGYQYLDAAFNLASGECFCTRVAVFDEQVAYGRMPVPFTHFAPGYPLLMTALAKFGIREETAGYLLSALGYLAVIWLMWEIGLTLGASPWVIALFSLLWITHATALYYAAMVGTESLFTALLLLLAALIARDVRSKAMIGVVAGLAYWIRYPGLFLVASAGVYLIFVAWRVPRERRSAIGGLVASALLVGAIQIRNAIYSGSWQGGFKSAGGRHKIGAAAVDSVKAFLHLLTGDRLPLHLNVWTLLLLLSSAALLFAIWKGSWAQPALVWVVFIGVAYVGGIFVATLATIAGDLPRYYFPVYPLILACAAVVSGRSLAVIPFVIAALAVQGPNLFVRPDQPDWVLTRSYLSESEPSGASLLDWLRNHVGPNETILAVEGQALHYILQRNVVAVVPARDTTRRSDEEGFHTLMRQNKTRYLVVFPGAPADRVLEQTSYGFMSSLAAGSAPPWLRLAARTRDAAVYECPDCSS